VKLLFDQNISFRIIKKLQPHFDGSAQIRHLGLENSTDTEIWKYARQNGYNIITFDSDFADLATIYGHPPKIIWLRIGNTSTNGIAAILDEKVEVILEFVTSEKFSPIACLVIQDGGMI
jgi:predicted nuclease of predicted toxin-antitoxin system